MRSDSEGPGASENRVLLQTRLTVASLAAATSAPATMIFLIVAAFWYGNRCGDGCGPSSGRYAVPGWSQHADSIMWSVQFWAIAIPALLAVALYVVLLAYGLPAQATVALLFALVAMIVWRALPWWTGDRPGNWTSEKPLVWVALVLMLAGAAVSVLLEVLDQRRKRLAL